MVIAGFAFRGSVLAIRKGLIKQNWQCVTGSERYGTRNSPDAADDVDRKILDVKFGTDENDA